jgi:hypothetical protein
LPSTVYWIERSGKGWIGILSRPRGGDWLASDMAAIRSEGVDVVVSMLTKDESEDLGLAEEEKKNRCVSTLE